MCGKTARLMMQAKNPEHRMPTRGGALRCFVEIAALPVMVKLLRPKKYLPVTYRSTEEASITATSAYGIGLPPISLMPLKICTEVTR